VSQWVRLLNRATGAPAEWHFPRTKSFATTTYCGKNLAGPLEVASDDKAEREERCSPCMTHLAPMQVIVSQRPSQPMVQTPASPVSKAKPVAKMTAAKKTVRKSVAKGRSSKASVAKRPVRRVRRGRA
jgi:hypothetical protein